MVVSVQLCEQTFGQHWPGEALRDHKRVVAESFKKFAQHLGLFGVLGHPIHFSLQLLGSNWPLPKVRQRLRFA
jgi:hypothetical protein